MLSEFQIPHHILREAKGIVSLSIVKAGFIFSGKIGSGLVIAHLGDKEWSAPSALGTGGAGWGLQIGAKETDLILILNTKAALDSFSRGGRITLGGSLSVVAGPYNETAAGVVNPSAAIYAYGRSQGIFAGISLNGAVITEREDANYQFYGKRVTPYELLSGKIPQPKSADNLYRQLEF